MTPPIDSKMKIGEIVKSYPETEDVFKAHGLTRLIEKKSMDVLSPFLTIGMALRTLGVDEQSFISLLNLSVENNSKKEIPPVYESLEIGKPTLLSLMPCGLKMPFTKDLEMFLRESINDINCAVEGNLNQELSYYTYIGELKEFSELPDILITSDFNSLYHHRFFNDFIMPGNFEKISISDRSKSFEEAGIFDPDENYFIVCVNPLVIVADLDVLDEEKIPENWDDLLSSDFKKSITLRGNEEFFCHAVLLPFFKEHGENGIKKLAENVNKGMHPAEMVKSIDSGKGDSAVYVMPEFFAQKIKKKEKAKIIWPKDGAIASPVTMHVKKGKKQELKWLIDYLTSDELMNTFENAYFPSCKNNIKNNLRPEKKLKWLGWDFIRKNDLVKINLKIDEIFLPVVREKL